MGFFSLKTDFRRPPFLVIFPLWFDALLPPLIEVCSPRTDGFPSREIAPSIALFFNIFPTFFFFFFGPPFFDPMLFLRYL